MNPTQKTVSLYNFVVHETPYCIWLEDLHDQNMEYISRVDPGYFEHIVQINSPLLEGDSKQYAALALRATYSQALETFFALMFSTIQAPGATMAWMLKYKNQDLRALIKNVHNSDPVKSFLIIKKGFSWEDISELVFAQIDDPKEFPNVAATYALLWRRLASDFLDIHRESEYNSIKHGLRVSPGGFKVTLRSSETLDGLSNSENIRELDGSYFGSKRFTVNDLKDKTNFTLDSNHINWWPDQMMQRLRLISSSIRCLKSYMQYINGADEATLECLLPQDLSIFESAWTGKYGIASMVHSTTFHPDDCDMVSKAEILESYNQQGNVE